MRSEGDTAEDHGPEPAVADGESLHPAGGGLAYQSVREPSGAERRFAERAMRTKKAVDLRSIPSW